MSTVERCRTASLGGHVLACENAGCGRRAIGCNSCRNRHCPKRQGSAARDWLPEREAEPLPIGYFHLVFTLPKSIADIAFWNKRLVYGLLFKASAEAVLTIAADPKHLGAGVAVTSVLHTWGLAMTHHPHVHMMVPRGGISLDGQQWVASRPDFILSVRVLSRLFRRLFLQKLLAAHSEGKLRFFNDHADLADAEAFAAFLAPLGRRDWEVYSKDPFGGPGAVLAYLARYTYRVAVSNRRLIGADADGVTFRYMGCWLNGANRTKTRRPETAEFIRRFLMHVLPKGFHRVRHYGLLADRRRVAKIVKARVLLEAAAPKAARKPTPSGPPAQPNEAERLCPHCGGRMIVAETTAPTIPSGRRPNTDGIHSS